MARREKPQPTLIQGDTLYALDEFKRRMGLGPQAWRTARRQGAPVVKIANRTYVDGTAFLQWLRQHTCNAESNTQ